MSEPVMDVVILSRAENDHLRTMTQRAISTCVRGANLPINVIVMEQIPDVVYADAVTVAAPEQFAYNAFANHAIREYGSAPWVMVANNDLIFGINWLNPLINAGEAVVSPIDPRNRLQRAYIGRSKVSGQQVGVHFSGWCFAMRRCLWDEIGGLDEDFTFWCADDAVVQQVVTAGHTPTLIPASRVSHAVSATHRDVPDPESDRTWAQAYKYEQKYGHLKFTGIPAYEEWKKEKAR